MSTSANDTTPKFTISVSRKVNLGSYESADVFISVSNLTGNESDDELDELIEATRIPFEKVKAAVQREARGLRDAGRDDTPTREKRPVPPR